MSFELSPCVLVRKEEIEATLAQAPAPGKRLLEPLKSRSFAEKLPLNILEDKEVSNEAEAHRHEGDLWHCLEGEVMFVYGGEMVSPWAKQLPDGGIDDREIKAKEISGGTESGFRPASRIYIELKPPRAWPSSRFRPRSRYRSKQCRGGSRSAE